MNEELKLLVEWSSPWQEFLTAIRPALGAFSGTFGRRSPDRPVSLPRDVRLLDRRRRIVGIGHHVVSNNRQAGTL